MKNNILYRGDPYEKREATLSHRRSAFVCKRTGSLLTRREIFKFGQPGL